MAIRIVCATCGSANVTRDAWDETRPEWRLGAVFDDGFCHRCATWAELTEEPLAVDAPVSVVT